MAGLVRAAVRPCTGLARGIPNIDSTVSSRDSLRRGSNTKVSVGHCEDRRLRWRVSAKPTLRERLLRIDLGKPVRRSKDQYEGNADRGTYVFLADHSCHFG